MSIPLDMPSGQAGFAPELAISYSSSAPEGALGLGFALTGASSIGRCSKQIALDGEISNVQFTEDDALCLDGIRLIAIRFPIRKRRSLETSKTQQDPSSRCFSPMVSAFSMDRPMLAA